MEKIKEKIMIDFNKVDLFSTNHFFSDVMFFLNLKPFLEIEEVKNSTKKNRPNVAKNM